MVDLCSRVVFGGIVVGLRGSLDDGVQFEGGGDGDERDVEDFGRHPARKLAC